MCVVRAIEARFILGIERSFSNLWTLLVGGYGKEKFLEVVFRILL